MVSKRKTNSAISLLSSIKLQYVRPHVKYIGMYLPGNLDCIGKGVRPVKQQTDG